MSAELTIDQKLYRPLKSGIEYEGLIPPFSKTDYKFDDTDSINTFDTLKYMSEWAKKYAYQMQKVAAMLKGRTIEETIYKIHQFLFWHFQYRLDGQLQNLYAPSAAWFYRQSGFDCKTYSLLASCILQNLNINHSFRMVQQKGVMPGQWSHVYVIVNENGKELVIDATKKDNVEVSYTKKYDMNMHRGLACPCTEGLGSPGLNLTGINAGLQSTFGGNSSGGGFWGTVNNLSGGNIGGVAVNNIQGVVNGSQPVSTIANNLSIQGVKGNQIVSALQGNTADIAGIAGNLTKKWTVVGVPATTLGRAAVGDPMALVQVAGAVGGKLAGKLSIAGVPLKDYYDGIAKGDPSKIFNTLKSMLTKLANISRLKCIGGTAFGAAQLSEVKANLDAFVTDQIIKINILATEGAVNDLSKAISEFFAVTDMAKTILHARQAEGLNKCTRENLEAASNYAYQLNQVLGAGLTAWADKFYPLDSTEMMVIRPARIVDGKVIKQGLSIPKPVVLQSFPLTTIGNQFANAYKIMWTETSQKIESQIAVWKRKISPTETKLMAFVPSDYLGTFSADTVGNFSKETFLGTLKTVLAEKAPEVVANTPTPNGAPATNGTPNAEQSKSSFLPLAAAGLAVKLLFFS